MRSANNKIPSRTSGAPDAGQGRKKGTTREWRITSRGGRYANYGHYLSYASFSPHTMDNRPLAVDCHQETHLENYIAFVWCVPHEGLKYFEGKESRGMDQSQNALGKAEVEDNAKYHQSTTRTCLTVHSSFHSLVTACRSYYKQRIFS